MAGYLLTLSIGPVQGFIAAARRSRDLWFGSYLLSEAVKGAAAYLRDENQATLIFPHHDIDLASSNPDGKISNVILAHAATDNPKALLEEAKRKAHGAWIVEADKVWDELSGKGTKIRLDKALWDSQAKDILEFSAVWVGVSDCEDEATYRDAYRRLNELLEARKNTRHFQPSEFARFGYHKSTLDGLRESVIPAKTFGRETKVKTWLWWRYRWGIDDGEALDCLGLVKRVGGKLSYRRGNGTERIYEHFTPLSRIAADPWLCGVCADPAGAALLEKLYFQLNELVSYELASPVLGNGGIYEDFPYDGQLLYPFRLSAEMPAQDKSTTENKLRQRLETLREKLTSLWKAFDEPLPYLAILQADGDRMGELLRKDRLCKKDKHQDVSRKLSEFSDEARRIVQGHRGHAIYSGGDDVLALLPLNTAVECAEELRSKFAELLQAFGSASRDDEPPTLSVGLAIGHFLEPLPVLLDLARRAEKLAKGDGESEPRNALGILLKPRSGGEVAMRRQWTTEPQARLKYWTDEFNTGRLPDRTPYLLREADERFRRIADDASRESTLAAVVRRIVQRRRGVTGDTEQEQQAQQALRKRLIEAAKDRRIGLSQLVAELLIARRLAVAAEQAAPSKRPPAENAATAGETAS